MKSQNYSFILFFLMFCFFSGSIFFSKKILIPKPFINKEIVSLNFKAKYTKLLSLGLSMSYSDLLWIHTLLASDHEHYKKNDLNSWMHLRFFTISQLDPKFIFNYIFGGMYLMVIKDDIEGAENILLKGLKEYPNHTGLNWQLGFLYLFEKKDTQASLKYLGRIKDNMDRPRLFDTIYTKLIKGEFGDEEAYRYAASSYYNLSDDNPIKPRMGNIAYALKAKIDLKCLSDHKPNCDLKDFKGSPYQKINGKWQIREKLPNIKWI